MKLLVLLLGVFAFASAGKLETRDAMTRSAASEIVDAIERLRDQMPCGFESQNIPPLAPLKIEHKEVSIETQTMSAQGEVNKARIYGLNEFEITDMRVNVITSKVTFGFNWEDITIKGLYDLDTILKGYGITVDIKGMGNMLLSVKDINVRGSLKYSLGLVSKQIKLKELKIIISVGDVDANIDGLLGQGLVNRKLNEIIEEVILLSVNDNEELITQTIEDIVLPTVNNAVEGMSLGDLIAAIGGGESSEPTVCIPPPPED